LSMIGFEWLLAQRTRRVKIPREPGSMGSTP
jgi:hypothetical protein